MPFKFAYLCDLLSRLEALELQDVPLTNDQKCRKNFDIIQAWFKGHRKNIDADHVDRVALLSAMLPERRTDRVYGLQAPSLAKILARCLGLGAQRLKFLYEWTGTDREDLAQRIYGTQRVTDAGLPLSTVTVEEIDAALSRIAAQCRFSSPHVRASAEGKPKVLLHEILRPIFRRLPARDLKWLIRMILKRFDPVTLDENIILTSFHFLLPRFLKFQSGFHTAVHLLNKSILACIPAQPDSESESALRSAASAFLAPRLGIMIGRPEYYKARSIKHCLQLTGTGCWNIEPKYDGEYCQLHVDLSKGQDCIQIFSKSERDSTKDRTGLHAWIKGCLRIGKLDCRFKHSCILEGEMVVYSDIDNSILEFSKIRKHVNRSGSFVGKDMNSQAHPHEHLMIVFFDALLIDDDMVMSQKYEVRRRRLKELLFYSPGPSPTADWGTLDLARISAAKATEMLERLFAKAISQRREGLILKPCEGPYFSLSTSTTCQNGGRIIKLKKDAIAGLGDTADFAIIGASYNAVQAHKLPSRNLKWTNFTLACLENKGEVLRFQARPRYKIMGTVARPCVSVEDVNHLCMVGQFSDEPFLRGTPPSNFDLNPNDAAFMSVVFKKPFVVEVLGSGFHKPPLQDFYMLRHCRIVKIHQDRTHADIVSFAELQELARQAMNIPDNLKQEETEWLHRLQKAGTPKHPRYLERISPISQATTESALSTRTSPCKTLRRTSPAILVRIDSTELLDTESRHALGTPARPEKWPSVIAGPVRTHRLLDPPKSPALIIYSGNQNDLVTAVNELGKGQKRTLANTGIRSANGRPPKKRILRTHSKSDNRDAAGVTPPTCKHDLVRVQPDERAHGKMQTLTSNEITDSSKTARLHDKLRPMVRAGQENLSAADVIPATVNPLRTRNTAINIKSKALLEIANSPPTRNLRKSSTTASLITMSSAKVVNNSVSREVWSFEDQTACPEPQNYKGDLLTGQTVSMVGQVSTDIVDEFRCNISGPIIEKAGVLKCTKTSRKRTEKGFLENKQCTSPTGAETLPSQRARLSVAVNHLSTDIQKPPEGYMPLALGLHSPNAAFGILKTASYDDKMSKPTDLSSPLSVVSSDSFHSACSQLEKVYAPRLDRAPVSTTIYAPVLKYSRKTLSFPSPFQTHTFYLSPCISSAPYITQNLIPLLDGQHTPASLSHWDRDIQPHLTPYDPVVSESQAHVGLQKAVLVESRRIQPTMDLIEKLKKLPLAKGEVMELWDWRVAEQLAECTQDFEKHINITSARRRIGWPTGQVAGASIQTVIEKETRAKVERALAMSYVGCIRFNAVSRLNVYEAADTGEGFALAAKWMGKVGEDAQGSSRRGEISISRGLHGRAKSHC